VTVCGPWRGLAEQGMENLHRAHLGAPLAAAAFTAGSPSLTFAHLVLTFRSPPSGELPLYPWRVQSSFCCEPVVRSPVLPVGPVCLSLAAASSTTRSPPQQVGPSAPRSCPALARHLPIMAAQTTYVRATSAPAPTSSSPQNFVHLPPLRSSPSSPPDD
jgi:hypothetical protein